MTRTLAGHPLLWLDEATSTNDVARRGLLDGRLRDGVLVVADRQTAGRGRRGHGWVTVPRRALAASLLTRPPPGARAGRATVLAAVALCRALEAQGAPPLRIKWPNDVMRGERKCGGLLCEACEDENGDAHLVLGIGVNLALRDGDLPAPLADRATDAGLASSDDLRERVLAAFVREWDAGLGPPDGPDGRARREEYARRSWLDGRRVRLRAAGAAREGRVVRVTEDGDLVLEDDEGRHLLPGETTELIDAYASAR